MIRKIKKLALAFVVVGAMSLAGFAVASASEYHINTSEKAVLTGEQTTQLTSTLTTGGNTIKCTQALFEGTVQGGSPQITVQEFTLTPIVTGCQAFGLAATLNFNGCKFTITNKSAAGTTTAGKAYSDLVGCTVGKQLEAIVPGCTITSPEQNNIGHVVGVNTAGPPSHIEVNLTLQGITYEFHGAACAGPATTLQHNGDLTGKITLKAYKDEGSIQATHNGHQYQKLVDGLQVGLTGT